jgi:hypothetical protein
MVDHPAVAAAELETAQPYDTSDPKQVNTARKRAARFRRERLDEVRTIMGRESGRAWVYGHLESCSIFSTTFTHGDPHASSFKEGERNAGLRLLADVMEAAPDQYVVMVREGKSPRK